MYSADYFEGLEQLLGSEGMEIAMVMFVVFMIAYLIAIVISVLTYIFTSVSLFSVGKRRGLKLYGMAWVPVGQQWLLGCIADQYDRKAKGKDMKLGKFLLIGYIVMFIAAVASLVAVLAGALGMGSAEMMGKVSPSGYIAALAIGTILLVLVYLFLIVWAVFHYIALFKFYRSCSPRNSVWMLLLSIFFTLGSPICMLCVRKLDGGFEALQQEREAAEEAEPTEATEE